MLLDSNCTHASILLQVLKQTQKQEQGEVKMAVSRRATWQAVNCHCDMSIHSPQMLLMDLTEVTQAAAKSQETMMQPWAMSLVLLSHIYCTSLKSTKR